MRSLRWHGCQGLLILLGYLLLGGNVFAATEERVFTGPFNLVWQAYLSAGDNLHSGAGSGVYEVYTEPAGSAKVQLTTRANVKTRFDGPKYYIRLDYGLQPDSDGKPTTGGSRIIINDGTGLFVSIKSPPGVPRTRGYPGSYAEVFHPRGNAVLSPDRAGFPFNPARMPDQVFWFSKVIEVFSPEFHVVKQEDGSLMGSYTAGNARWEFNTSPESGFHVVASRSFTDGDSSPDVGGHATWQEAGGIWFVKALTTWGKDATGRKETTTLRYDAFEPNAKVPPEAFTLQALELPDGAKIMDREEGGKTDIYTKMPTGDSDQAKVDKLIDQVKSLPRVRNSPPPSSAKRYFFLALSAILVLAGLILLWRRVLARRRPG